MISSLEFIDGLNKAGLTVNRKMLSELAIDNPKAFSDLVIIAKDALNGKEYKPSKVVLESKKDDKKIVKETKTATKKVEAKEEKTTKGTTKKATTKKATTKKEEK